MHIGINVENERACSLDKLQKQHVIIQVDENVLDELEEAFSIHSDSDEKTEDEQEPRQQCEQHYVVHFTCELRTDSLTWLCTAITAYASYFAELHISIACSLDNQSVHNLSTTSNYRPSLISAQANNLLHILSHDESKLSLQAFHLYVSIGFDLYSFMHSILSTILHNDTFIRFMDFEDESKQTLSFILGLPGQNHCEESTSLQNMHQFLAHSSRIDHIELVVKTQTALYTNTAFHAKAFNQLLASIQRNKHCNTSFNSIKITCWGFIHNLHPSVQQTFAQRLKRVIIGNKVSKLWLRYAGVNESILTEIFDGIQQNEDFTHLRLQRIYLNDAGKCLAKLGHIVRQHVSIEHVQIGWNKRDLPGVEHYNALLMGIGQNRYNLRSIELCADTLGRLNVLDLVLRRNSQLQDIRLHISDWYGTEDEHGFLVNASTENDLLQMCRTLMDVMVNNELYLQQQVAEIRANLQSVCRFHGVLIGNVLQFLYPKKASKEHGLSVEVIMDCSDETHTLIQQTFQTKVHEMQCNIPLQFTPRSLLFKISKPWPG